jgi:AcrR family transcriptional regulator
MGTAERKAREKLLRHQQILDAAYDVFNQVGFHAATIDQIAERAELAKGTIYIYFKSKEELYFSLLTHGLDILISLLKEMETREPQPERLLEETASTLFRFYKEHRSYFRIFMVMQQEDMQAKLSPELSHHLNEQATKILNHLSAQVQKVIDNGSHLSVNPWRVANILWGAFTGITQLAITREQMKVRPKEVDDLLSLCFDMIQRGLSAEIQAPETRGQGSGVTGQGADHPPQVPQARARKRANRKG